MPNSSIPKKIVIATRESALALWQANFIREQLAELYPQTEISIFGMTTRGDQILDTSLSKIGGKGLFIKELEQALEDKRADIAVHSMKDVPMDMPEGFTLAAIAEREDPRDAFISNQYAESRRASARKRGGNFRACGAKASCALAFRICKCSRCGAMYRPGCASSDEGQFAAIILAAAGLKTTGTGRPYYRTLSPELSLPAVGQGALGIECRTDRADLIKLCSPTSS